MSDPKQNDPVGPPAPIIQKIRHGHLRYVWMLAIVTMLYIWWFAPLQIDKILLVVGKVCVGAILGMGIFLAMSKYFWHEEDEKDRTWFYCCIAFVLMGMYTVSQAV